jgi:phosphotransferase system enzyme I (PtsP)
MNQDMSATERDHLVFLREVSETLALPSGDDPDAFLQRIVALITSHIRADVASIYLYDRQRKRLVLRANRGLAPDSVDRVQLRMGEGLVGHVMETLEPLREKAASHNPLFKHVVGINEEPYESFLAVPLHRGGERLGVLVAQRREADYFGPRDMIALQTLAVQLTNAIDTARTLRQEPGLLKGEPPLPRLIQGRIVSPGYAFGPVVRIDTVHTHRRLAAGPFVRRYSLEDLHTALQATDSDLTSLEQRFSRDLPEMAALIFSAHQMMLMDPQFAGGIIHRVEQGENPPEAIVTVAHECRERFAAHQNPYIQDKASDIEDLAARLLNNLLGTGGAEHGSGTGQVALARNLYPSDVVELYARDVRGIVLAHGGDTSHVVLLVRSLDIPALIIDQQSLFELEEGTRVLLDAHLGNLYVDPPKAALTHLPQQYRKPADTLRSVMKPQTHTRDGTRVHLLANINLLGEASLAAYLRAEGVGLYRSEFPFLLRPAFPTEEEQVIVYQRLIQDLHGRPVTVRTLDLGGDKASHHHILADEENPQLGLRSIRFSLRYPHLFHQQLRAILRGGAETDQLRIMFPMIGSLEELRAARAAVREAVQSLRADGLPHCDAPQLGMMVELPSVVALMDEFAREVDFFSIGTNDFVQYMLAVDRGNQDVAFYYRYAHPAVLRAIEQIVRVSLRHRKPVTLCGEMAHELRFVTFLLGIGVRSFSVAPYHLFALQQAIETVDLMEARELALRVLGCGEIAQIEDMLGGAV